MTAGPTTNRVTTETPSPSLGPWRVLLWLALPVFFIFLFFSSGSLPRDLIAQDWFRTIATLNPVSYLIEGIRSLFITGINGSFYSFVHLLSGWTIIALPMAIYAIRNRNVERHRRGMTGMFVGGLIIAGLLTFLPGRLMWNVFLG